MYIRSSCLRGYVNKILQGGEMVLESLFWYLKNAPIHLSGYVHLSLHIWDIIKCLFVNIFDMSDVLTMWLS